MLPTLPAPYDAAFNDTLQALKDKSVQAILLAGSAAKGTLHPPTSDLDVLVVDDGPWCIKHEMVHGIELHLSSGAPSDWRAAWQREVHSDLGANISLLAGGTIVYDPTGIAADLLTEARALYAEGPKLDTNAIEMRRRWLTDVADDLRAAPTADQPYLCALFVNLLVPCAFTLNEQWRPRHKEAMRLLTDARPSLAQAVNAALRSQSAAAYTDLIQEAGLLLEPHGGWFRPPRLQR